MPKPAELQHPNRRWWQNLHNQWIITTALALVAALAGSAPAWIALFSPSSPTQVINMPSLPAVGDSPGQPLPQIDQRCADTPDNRAGWGPDRPTVQGPVSYLFYPGFNADRVNPNIGDERNMAGGRREGSDNLWSNDITVEDGATYILRIYIHNSAQNGDDTVATGTRVRMPLPTCEGKRIAINGFVKSPDAFPIEVWGGVNLSADRKFKVTYVPNSARLEGNLRPRGDANRVAGTDFLAAPGQLVGQPNLDGNVRGGWGNAMYFSIIVKVTMV